MGRITMFAMRFFALSCLVGSLVILLTSSHFTSCERFLYSDYQVNDIKFTQLSLYTYMLVSIGVGIAYNLFQTALSLSIGVSLLDLFGDMVISNILVSGAAASYGFTLELGRTNDLQPSSFFNKIYISAGLSLVATPFTLISLISAHAALRFPAQPRE
ncbi:CASP-like protein 4D1 [Lycium barbarum]|uniref:CASP-like protein 4D1 n=1 Tax=Lycium barbarum TaxID=112863 RepID=UPI00293E566C|nr:CASP-like protein 4D1 [Lycium barbarum]